MKNVCKLKTALEREKPPSVLQIQSANGNYSLEVFAFCQSSVAIRMKMFIRHGLSLAVLPHVDLYQGGPKLLKWVYILYSYAPGFCQAFGLSCGTSLPIILPLGAGISSGLPTVYDHWYPVCLSVGRQSHCGSITSKAGPLEL
ncbi:hypothetical protein ACROYT_G006996 [Oculina patagonica]